MRSCKERLRTPGLSFLVFLIATPIVLRGIHYRERLEESRSRELRAQREALRAQVEATGPPHT